MLLGDSSTGRALRDEAARSRGGGILSSEEIEGLKLDGTLLTVLSQCHVDADATESSSFLGRLIDALRLSGSQAVLVNLRDTGSLSAQFLSDFYRTWLEAGFEADPAIALRATQLKWLSNEDALKHHPASWSGYVLYFRRYGRAHADGSKVSPL
jgi:CHAT domain-containing protein